MFPVAKPQQYVSAASLTSNVDAETVNTRCLQDLNSDATMKVCRVCLAMSVKMYHMSEHKLSDMYERVTGVVIKTEDRLPKMLCWECVARLSSANSYVEKALKTHWILMKKLNSNKFITFNDIESIDRAQYQLDSTLGVKFFQEDDSNFIKESETVIDNDNEESGNIYAEIKTEFYEPNNLDQSSQEQQIFITEYVTNEKDPIKNEHLDEECEKEKKANFKFKTQVICKQENISDEEVEDISNASEMSEEEDHMVDYSESQKRKQSLPLLRIPRRKEKYCKEVQAQPSKDHFVFNVPLKKEVLLEETNNLAERVFINTDAVKEDKDTNSSGVETGTVNSDISNNHNVKRKFFICDICDKLFNNKTALVRHIKDRFNCNPTKKVSFNCSHCNFKSNQKEGLSRHINAKHTKRELYSCSYCSFTTYRKQNVSRHVNAMHTKSNVFNCSYCDFKSYRNSHLNAHINSKHTKTISFDCTHCSYKAYEKRNLMAHINAKHTQKSLYNCPSCVYQTFYKSVLYRHVKDKHSEKISIPGS